MTHYSAPVARTDAGPVVGRIDGDVLSFRGIPFAGPPVGVHRFAAPQPVDPWADPRDVSQFSKGAPQRAGQGLTNAVGLPWDEAGCLALNVQTAGLDGSRPVMVWIHGGDFRHGMGAIPWYNGDSFVRNGDIVVVSINYRLGAFGFVALDHLDEGAAGSGVAGILDQLAALRWVQANIANFGGDPDRVTIMGESAGAYSVGALLAMPDAAPLFSQAILQSGAGHASHSAEQGRGVAQWLVDAAGCNDVADPLAALRAMSADQLLDAQEAVYAKPGHKLGLAHSPFYPVVDGHTLPMAPIDAMRSGASIDKPVLMGTNAEETRLWGTQATPDDRLEKLVRRVHPDPVATIDAYRSAGRGQTAGELAVAIGSDAIFGVPSLRMADTRTEQEATTFLYRFSWQSRAFDGALGSCHALEIPFVFNNLDAAGVDAFIGEGPSPQPVADAMHEAWTSFIQTGRPLFAAGPDWVPYSAETNAVIDFGDEVALVADPVAGTLSCWDGIR